MLDHEATGQQSFNCQKIEPMVSRAAAAEVLGADLDALGLQHLADVEEAGESPSARDSPCSR